ncbi:hypothetical protein [Microtetraspora sp. NBRC 16547]|uniref:hypothetical protein n=1 Tax=Microtetraspora sp. NBRC 16547 TaxID=3030993 RepID=UPI002553C9AB|nr:hypothetical protein [Microtetraspora sp. NBRC 16547]
MKTALALGDRVLSALVPRARAAATECDYVTCTVYATCCSGSYCWSCWRTGRQYCCSYPGGRYSCGSCN